MVLINNVESNESKEHLEAKVKLFERLTNGKITFINQFGKPLTVTPNKSWTHLYMEAYVYANDKNNDSYFGSSCLGCFCHTEEFKANINRNKDYIYEDSVSYCLSNRFDKSLSEIIFSNKDGATAFTQHPCSLCKYKGNSECIAIFDIAVSKNEQYILAIEVVKTSPCSENKIKYCKDNNIFLIEVNYNDILKMKKDETELPCISKWWYEKLLNGKGIKYTC
ncbi:hypothetical protein V7128_01410 [Neobacillus vireti]|uniref:hypothetical protein n=1 Tax=Neobacillus vireti TaxID=220686 RepID=UPI0030009531